MNEKSIYQYERIRKGYPGIFSTAHKITKLIIKASKKGYEPNKTWRYIERLKQLESRKKDYREIQPYIIDIFLDAKLTTDEEREKVKQYYRDVMASGKKDINDLSMLKEYIRYVILLDI
jgi:hypothetical protein